MKEIASNLSDVVFALPGIVLTVACWGAYGSVLHKGQHALENDRLKPLICVGAAYFIVAILVPVAILALQGKLGGAWSWPGVSWSMAAGAAGAAGALGIILALTAGGKPVYVMPLVFGGAPVVNVLVSMYAAKIPWKAVHPVFLTGMAMVAFGAVLVLAYQPKAGPPAHAGPAAARAEEAS